MQQQHTFRRHSSYLLGGRGPPYWNIGGAIAPPAPPLPPPQLYMAYICALRTTAESTMLRKGSALLRELEKKGQ